jgi:hypothetical protein
MMQQMKIVLARIWWLGRETATAMGLAVLLAVVLGVGTTALAAVPGDPFKLGRTNTIDQLSTLVGSNSGALLRINNNGSGPALDLRVEPGEAPMNVNSTTRVNGLNADQVDSHGANDFVSEDRIYTTQNIETGPGGGEDVEVSARCDSGDTVLGGGGGAAFPSNLLQLSEPTGGNAWRVIAQDDGNPSAIFADAICADFPPLRP